MVMLISVCAVLHGKNGSHPTGPETSALFRVVLEREDCDVVSCGRDGGVPEGSVDLPIARRPRQREPVGFDHGVDPSLCDRGGEHDPGVPRNLL